MKRPKRHQSKSQQKINSLNDSLRTCRKMCGEAMRDGLNYKLMLDRAERRIAELTKQGGSVANLRRAYQSGAQDDH